MTKKYYSADVPLQLGKVAEIQLQQGKNDKTEKQENGSSV
uniref:Uncharacterized protein n=1 Tax=Anguilla anguilla TaxID=7936 RepID=A0A0E9UQM0_ANGAN